MASHALHNPTIESEHSQKPSASPAQAAQTHTSNAAPTTFFLRRGSDSRQDAAEHALETESSAAMQDSEDKGQQSRSEQHNMQDSSYGVQSLADTLEAAFTTHPRDTSPSTTSSFSQDERSEASLEQPHSSQAPSVAGKKRKAGNPVHPKILAAAQRIISGEQSTSRRVSTSPKRATNSHAAPPPRRKLAREASETFVRRSPSPLHASPHLGSGSSSTPGSASVRSLRLSDEEGSVVDETGSQAVRSSSAVSYTHLTLPTKRIV